MDENISETPNGIAAPHRHAGFGRRFVAQTIDVMFISLITFILQSMIGQNPFSYLTSLNNPDQLLQLRSSPGYLLAQAISYILYGVYLIIFWVYYDGATPGKRLLAIRIIREDEQKITLPIAFVRIIGMIFSSLPLGLGYLWVIWDSKKQSWHDKLAKTYVIRTEAHTKTVLVVTLFTLSILYQLFIVISGGIIGYLTAKPIAEQQTQTRQSVKTYQQASGQLPPDAKTHFDRSQELFKQIHEVSNDPKKVRVINDENIIELKKAVEIASDSARIWYELGNAYTWISSNGTLEDGLAAYGKAEELEPNNVIYVTNVGDMLIRLGKNQDAVLQLQKALRMSSDYAAPEYLIGVAYKNIKIYDEAKNHLEKALEIYKNSNESGSLDEEILRAQQQLAEIPK